MEKEFIPYEQALALKELGFESPYPIGGYKGDRVFYYENGELYYDGRPMYSSDAHSGQLLALLYRQAFRWFREKYELYYTIEGSIKEEFQYFVYTYEYEIKSEELFNTYEKAELKCLKKLIEIVKENNLSQQDKP